MKIIRAIGLGVAIAWIADPAMADYATLPPEPPVCTPLPAVPASAPANARAFAEKIATATWSTCRLYDGEILYRAMLLQRTGNICRLRLRTNWSDPDSGMPRAPDAWGWSEHFLWSGAGPCPDVKPRNPYDEVDRAYSRVSADLRDKQFIRILMLLERYAPAPGSGRGEASLKGLSPEARLDLGEALANPHNLRTIHVRSWLFGLFRTYKVNLSNDDYDLDIWEVFGRAWLRKAENYIV